MLFFPGLLRLSLSFSAFLFVQFSFGQAQSTLKLSEIMAGNDFIGHQPYAPEWSPDGKTIYFRWKRDNNKVAPYFQFRLREDQPEQLIYDRENPQPIAGWISDPADKHVYFKAGSSVYEWVDGKSRPIYTSTTSYQLIAATDCAIIIKQGLNAYALNTEKGTFNQLTNFDEGSAPPTSTTNYLEQQELELLKTVRDEKERTAQQTAFRQNHQPEFIAPSYLSGFSPTQLTFSSDLSHLVFTTSRFPSSNNTTYTEYVTASGHATTQQARPKVGRQNPEHHLYSWDFANDTTIKINVDHLTDLHRIPEFHHEYPHDDQPENYTKSLIFHIHNFNTTGDKCLVEIKSYDNKDRWIGYIDTHTHEFVEIDHQHDEAWIGGPGISGWKSVAGIVDWIDDNSFYFQSEKTGYSHLYRAKCERGTKPEALTSGDFEIHAVQQSKDHERLFITTNQSHPGNRSFYELDLKTLDITPILTAPGNHKVTLSPDEKWLLVNFSYQNKPWELYYAPNKPNTSLIPITHSTTNTFESYSWRTPEVIQFKASDGKMIHARIYEPENAVKNGAAVLFVHGAGYLQNAHNWWSGYYREYMFNNLLCDLGYTVLDIDYRASKGYGRDFRTAIYRHMGGKDLSDYVDGRQYLIDQHGIDPNRVGIYGGSYGGFITLMALFNEPDKFQCGAAIRSVTDWAHYNHPYTANILNTPENDPVAFERSSPIYFAEGLAGHLLMLHGMEDDNVQYQDVVRLSQRLIELQKKNWSLIGYPIEPHGFKETTSWIDEYGRILELFETHLSQ